MSEDRSLTDFVADDADVGDDSDETADSDADTTDVDSDTGTADADTDAGAAAADTDADAAEADTNAAEAAGATLPVRPSTLTSSRLRRPIAGSPRARPARTAARRPSDSGVTTMRSSVRTASRGS
ncbi:MAG: hypothetical protein J07HN6_02228 [Halonotius sp. J07HN6]|nr:MAG: hypothetical protein J07HN6_02228 [Halonotius sp. J07HN6]